MNLIPNNLGTEFAALTSWLETKEYFTALKALRFARSKHDGFRKGGNRVPEFSHQLYQINFIRPFLEKMIHPEETIATIALHDTPEDTDVTFREVYDRFGPIIGEAVELMTKKKDGVELPYPVYFGRMALNPITTITKPVDRKHNLLTSATAKWSTQKLRAYADEADQYFLPLLKKGRQLFPEQNGVYYHLKTAIVGEQEWVRRYADMVDERDALKIDLSNAADRISALEADLENADVQSLTP